MLNYKGKDYLSCELWLKDNYFFYAESSLNEAMEENSELGCDLDCQICYYPTHEQMEQLVAFKKNNIDEDIILQFCKNNDIFVGDL